jgi:pimeloyl-ACP methyl ester carboxylesterase
MTWILLVRLIFALPLAAPASGWAADALAADDPVYGSELQGFDYPAPVHRFTFTSQGNALAMAFMDVQPQRPNGRTIVLLHGKNFCGATWEASMSALSQAGYRVIVPDQIGFCKSSKPAHYQFSFEQLAGNTNALLHSIGVQHAIIAGHSTGGMLAIRYALMYPGEVDQLVLVDPIGLEDWQAKGVPWLGVDRWYENDQKTTAEGIRAYEQATYYAGQWRPQYQRWVDMLAGMYRGPGRDAVAWDSALLYDMIFNQPVVYELGLLKPPTLLIVGDKDTTAIGKQFASPEVRAKLGHYPELAKMTKQAIPNATLIEFSDLGHAPQIQDPEAFHKALIVWLAGFAANP